MNEDYLLDASIIIWYLRGSSVIGDMLNSLSSVKVSSVAAGEVLQGAKSKQDLRKIILILEKYLILPINEEISDLSIQLLKRFTLSHGLLILDALIAATAMTNDLTLVTDNVKHFKFIRGLRVVRSEEVLG